RRRQQRNDRVRCSPGESEVPHRVRAGDETMLNANVIEAIQATVDRKTAAGDMFTAYDITRILRDEGVRARHGQIKQIVHAMFCQCLMPEDYVRSLCDLGGRLGPAWLYHRGCDDPHWYGGESRFMGLFGSPG